MVAAVEYCIMVAAQEYCTMVAAASLVDHCCWVIHASSCRTHRCGTGAWWRGGQPAAQAPTTSSTGQPIAKLGCCTLGSHAARTTESFAADCIVLREPWTCASGVTLPRVSQYPDKSFSSFSGFSSVELSFSNFSSFQSSSSFSSKVSKTCFILHYFQFYE